MLENIPLVPLRVFVAVGRQGNFTRAAQSLGIDPKGRGLTRGTYKNSGDILGVQFSYRF